MKHSLLQTLCATWLFACGIITAQEKERWIPLDSERPEGSPVQVEVIEASPTETAFRIVIPGFFQTETEYGGQIFSSIRFVEPELSGLGFPRQQGEPGWWDFPEENRIAPQPEERFRRAFQIGTSKAIIPEKLGYAGFNSLEEMVRLGISPDGARPGIPTLQGLLSVNPRTKGEQLDFRVEIEKSETINIGRPLLPAGFAGLDQEDQGPFGFTPPRFFDTPFYANPDPSLAPQTTLNLQGNAGQFTVASFSHPLVKYVAPNRIEIPWNVTIYVKHLAGPVQFDCPFGWDHWLFKIPFINGAAIREAMTAKGIRIESSRSARYLILTPREYRDELDEFAKWKNSKGLSVDFAYVGSGIGDDVEADRNRIDAFLESYFRKHYCHGVYVLLVGDIDTIPSGRSSLVVTNPDASNTDSDHVYEVLGSDLFPSLYVGRLSVDNREQLLTQLSKILEYERSPVPGSWPTRALLCANSQNSNGNYGVDPSHPSKYAAAVNDIASYGSYTNPPSFEVLHAGAANNTTTRATNQDVIDSIDQGVGHVLYRGHGGPSSWVSGWDGSSTFGNSFDKSNDLPALANKAFPIVYSISCQNGLLRSNDSIAEEWMNLEGTGAVAHFGAAANSYTIENHERAKGIFRAIYESGFTRLGPALAEAERISYNASGGSNYWKSNTFCYNLLGDPELTIRKIQAFPPPWEGTITFEVPDRPFVSVLTQAGAPLRGYLVSVVLKNGDSLTGTTDDRGIASFKVNGSLISSYSVSGPDGVKEYNDFEGPVTTLVWFPIVENSPEGTPITVEICSCAETETEIEIRIPGFWKRTITYANQTFTQVKFPEVVTLGVGLPELSRLDAATNAVGLNGLLGREGLLADREQLLPKGERGWFNFPAEDPSAELSPTKYMLNLRVGSPQPYFPEEALGSDPRTVKEMIELGIDPRGARPGIPHLRGLISAAVGAQLGAELKLEKISEELHDFPNDPTLVPAGFQGSDNNEGYLAPELIDTDFLTNLERPYRGDSFPLTQPERMGGFEGCEFQVPLCQTSGPTGFSCIKRATYRLIHPLEVLDRDCIPYDVWINKPAFLNGGALLAKAGRLKLPILSRRSARYLILTPEEYVDDLAGFIAWKRAKGLTVSVATVGNSASDTIARDRDDIDEYIENFYYRNYCHGVYVLLIGDTSIMPSGRSNNVIAPPDGNNGASDHVYEVIGSGDFASVYVGRLSVNADDADDLAGQLAKILSYERSPAFGGWPLRATIAANSENDDGSRGVSASFPSKYALAANQIVNYGSYNSPPAFNLLHAGAASSGVTRATNQDLIDAINNNTGHVLYRGHGSTSDMLAGWDGSSSFGNSFESTELASLANTAYPIVYSIACQNNRIGQSDCLGEEFMSKADGGSVAFWSASVNSFTFENHERAKGIFRAIYENGFTRLGPALAEAERISSLNFGLDSAWRNNTFCYLLLGDPELTIRRSYVFPKFVFTGTLIQSALGRELLVQDSLSRATGKLRVNLEFEDGSNINALTDSEGKILIDKPTDLEVVEVTYFEEAGAPQTQTFDSTGDIITLDGTTVPEGQFTGLRVGTLGASSDGTPVNSNFSLAEGAGDIHNNLFTVSGNALVFTGTADHETLESYSIRIRANGGGVNVTQLLDIIVLDDRNEDADGDGLTEADEEDRYGTSDLTRDSDGDGLEDSKEVELAFGIDPSNTGLDPATLGLDSGASGSPFDPARDDSELIANLNSLGFFNAEDLVTLTPGALVIEKNSEATGFQLELQMERWSEENSGWFNEGNPIPWLYLPEEEKGILRVVPKSPGE